MEEYTAPKKPEAKWAPGTLDQTRKNIGPIDEEEAKKMMKKLGGEVFAEKSAPIDYSAFPRAKEYARKVVVGKSASALASEIASGKSNVGSGSASKNGDKYGYAVKENRAHNLFNLPELSSKERNLMDRIMMSDDYKIKPNFGFFNFVRHFKKNGTELVRKSFVEYDIQSHIEHLQAFITNVKSIIQISPETYKSKILTSQEDKFRILKNVGSWKMHEIKALALSLQDSADATTVVMLVPFVKAVYRDLMMIYYLGETKISNIFKDIYNDLIKYPKFDQKKALLFCKGAISEWFYVYSKVIKGLYPLLMRMCSNKFEYFQDFFLTNSSNILNFLGISKFDILLPNKKAARPNEAKAGAGEVKNEEKKEETEEQKKKKEEEKLKNNLVDAGIKLLDTMFPEAGFAELKNFPDMFPYFQPVYQFRDGYNLLAPENPLQITITLLRITEDIFQGCRNIDFSEENDDLDSDDKLTSVLGEWSLYREVLFEKNYSDQIKDLVNNEYSQPDFKSTLFGKKIMTSLLWQTKYNFLPHFSFDQLLLEKPKNDSPYRPLCLRCSFLLRFFTNLSKDMDLAASAHGEVFGIQNPWEKYRFDIPNPVSKRMDVLLGAKKQADSAATNANLIKYALCIVAVLDWWINDPKSPAYTADPTKIYRINESDGGPAFSAAERTDQNKLFAERVKRDYERQKQHSQSAGA